MSKRINPKRDRTDGKRRALLKRVLLASAGVAAGARLTGAAVVAAQEEEVTVSGAGVNVKEMPGTDSGSKVPLRESFALDPHYAQCIIEDNPAPFVMDTFSMGKVVIEPHTFFMAMYASDIHLVSVSRGEGLARVAKLAGSLECSTQAGVATTTIGSRSNIEVADFEIEAIDAGSGGGGEDRFIFHVVFDPRRAPLNHAIFGPSPTFTGTMVAGKISIGTPVTLPIG